MKKLYVNLFATALLLLPGVFVQAQGNQPAASPLGKLTQTVGLTEVSIEYSRPGVKGRTVFSADGLVPFGKTWRTGANAATKITFSQDVKLAGQDVKAGSYAVLTVPNAAEWKFMLYPFEAPGWSSYQSKTPAVSFTVPAMTWDVMVETLTFMVGNIASNKADIMMFWEKTGVTIPLEVK